MPSPNKWSYISAVLFKALESDPALTVQRVLNTNAQPNSSRILVYPFVAGGNQFVSDELNVARNGVLTMRIWADVKVPLEGANPTGKSFEAYANALSRIEACVAGLTLPIQETHQDGTTTVIYGANVVLFGGHVDNGDTTIQADCDIAVNYGTFR